MECIEFQCQAGGVGIIAEGPQELLFNMGFFV